MNHSDLKLIGLAAEDPGALQQQTVFHIIPPNAGPGCPEMSASVRLRKVFGPTHGKFLVAYSEEELSEMEP